jgi:type IV pilus assembly protein PilW
MTQAPYGRRLHQTGLTLVELLVAMVLSLVVVAAASAVYLVSSQSFTTVDASSQLQDSSRFANYILRRMIQQSGYEDYSASAAGTGRSQTKNWAAGTPVCVQSDICGFDNQVANVDAIVDATPPTLGILPGPFYTDTIAVQFQGQSGLSATGELTAIPDGSMIDCHGTGIPSSTVSPPVRGMSVLYVAINGVTGEPELNCSSRILSTGKGRPAVPLVRGVEVFQVMYEVANRTDLNKEADQFRWVRADQVATLPINNASGGKVSDAVNAWQSVVAVRFGMVIRSAPNAATIPTVAQTFFPLGQELATAGNPATTYVAPIDSRLRRVVTFTVHLRNKQNAHFQY